MAVLWLSPSIPADSNLDHFGVRMELQAVGFDVDEVLVGTYDTLFHKLSEFNINSQEFVKSLTLTHASGGIKIDFNGMYNFGTINHDGSFNVDGRKQVKVRILELLGKSKAFISTICSTKILISQWIINTLCTIQQ